jgi:hypothetical protein
MTKLTKKAEQHKFVHFCVIRIKHASGFKIDFVFEILLKVALKHQKSKSKSINSYFNTRITKKTHKIIICKKGLKYP